MRPVLVKAYGALNPATEETYRAVRAVLEDWYIPDAEVVEALRPFLCDQSEGKLDILDLEAWTLHRYFFAYGRLRDHTATLDKALEACSMH